MKFLAYSKLSEHRYKTPEGYLVCVDSVLARTGKQEYTRNDIFKDGSDEIIDINRDASEVFADKTLASFENKPLTIEHPDEDINPDNHNKYAVGFVRDIKRGLDGNDDVMLGTIVVTDSEAIELIESGKLKELSCGYDCDIDDEKNPQQRNIRGNHVALCEHGRAGIARIVDSTNDMIHKEIMENNKMNDDMYSVFATMADVYADKLHSYVGAGESIDSAMRYMGFTKSGNKYSMKKSNYTFVFEIDGKNVMYYVLKDSKIPSGWTRTKMRLDSVKDAFVDDSTIKRNGKYEMKDVTKTSEGYIVKMILANNSGKKYAIVYRPRNNDYAILSNYNPSNDSYDSLIGNYRTIVDAQYEVKVSFNARNVIYTNREYDSIKDEVRDINRNTFDKVADLLDKYNIDYDGDVYNGIIIRRQDVDALRNALNQNGIKYTDYREKNGSQTFYFEDIASNDCGTKDEIATYFVEFVRPGDNLSDYIGRVNVKANSEKEALDKAKRWAHEKYGKAGRFKIITNKYTNVETIDADDAVNYAQTYKVKYINHGYQMSNEVNACDEYHAIKLLKAFLRSRGDDLANIKIISVGNTRINKPILAIDSSDNCKMEDLAYRPYKFSTNLTALKRAITNADKSEIRYLLPTLQKDIDDYNRWRNDLTISDKRYFRNEMILLVPKLKELGFELKNVNLKDEALNMKNYLTNDEDYASAMRVIRIVKRVSDSDELKRLAYQFAQAANYFDRANSMRSRHLLAKEDESKLAELYNLGLKVYSQLSREVEKMKSIPTARQPYGIENETILLLDDAADRLIFMKSNRLAKLGQIIEQKTNEYKKLLRRG